MYKRQLLDDGTVTHYDVMFNHGIEQGVPVADLTVTVSESHMHAKKKKPSMMETAAGDTLKGEGSAPPKIADITPQQGGGEDSSKASKKGKPEMPLERLKGIMEKKKSEAYKAMLRSQGKMEEEAGTAPKTDKEKSLAKLAPPHDKITHADVMVGRGVPKKKTMKEFVEQLVESLSKETIYHKFPESNHLHLITHDGEQHHVIKGVSHTEENARRARDYTMKAGAKLAGKPEDHHREAFDNLEAHHSLAGFADEQHGYPVHEKPTKVHDSIEAYGKYHAKGDAKWSKKYHAGDF